GACGARRSPDGKSESAPRPAPQSRRPPMPLVELQPPLSATLPYTRYFEADSQHIGARFAVWVTTPPTYGAEPDRRYPAIYQPDGNLAAPLTIPMHLMLQYDPIHPIKPFIAVAVGCAGKDAGRMLAGRARDLLPPKGALPDGIEVAIPALVQTGLLDHPAAELYLHNLRNPAADRFLAFLTDELHPLI